MDCLGCGNRFHQQVLVGEILLGDSLLIKEWCEICQKELILVSSYEGCQKCGQICLEKLCEDCQEWQRIYEDELFIHDSLFFYNDAMKEWFRKYKFLGDKRLASCFSKDIAAYFQDKQEWLIVPIPLDRERFKKRGFNQVEHLLDLAGVKFIPLLKKVEGLESQSAKTKKERLETKQAFELNEKVIGRYKKQLLGMKILVVDDVYTTGRTIHHAKDCLKKLHPVIIKSFSLAR
ncbi:ComF family protein [Vagococcus intermedius]|uniref:Phosphoribosyltransferase family protein n=1 Tax=Vagococcus intermedius TaxID=2991418 RepID=A0AAF0I8G5_9ENTE|nr:phosphoribosyltransferase family protein [Vagococcus intermedius]WEG74129.1 phosphoribosyltransferase family protein [Vagococcus intermedius]WEG76209.1 phosphoribosyltransferase family protein [Vagococcus intermedius]